MSRIINSRKRLVIALGFMLTAPRGRLFPMDAFVVCGRREDTKALFGFLPPAAVVRTPAAATARLRMPMDVCQVPLEAFCSISRMLQRLGMPGTGRRTTTDLAPHSPLVTEASGN